MSSRLLPALLILLLLAACLPLSQHRQDPSATKTESEAMSLFIEGIDHFDGARRSKVFLKLEQDFPESDWNRRAKVLASLAGQSRLFEKQINRQHTLIDAQNNELLTLKAKSQENTLLHEQIKVLKALIVDLELHQP